MKRTTNGLPPIHPGEYIREILVELGFTQTAFAQAIGVSRMRVSHLLTGQRPVTAELALRLGRALGQTPHYWINLQSTYDLKIAHVEWKDSLKAVRALRETLIDSAQSEAFAPLVTKAQRTELRSRLA